MFEQLWSYFVGCVSKHKLEVDIVKKIALLGLGSICSITLMASESETYIEAEHYYYQEPGLMDKESAPLFVNAGTRLSLIHI